MFPHNEYTERVYHKELLRQADHRRLAREVEPTTSLTQRIGQSMLKFGAQFAMQDGVECVTIENRAGQVVTVCAA
jgi:hypothetical protein